MNKKEKLSKGDVAWYIKGKKKPIAYSTTSTKDLIDVLYEQYGNLLDVYKNISCDEDAKNICKLLLEHNIFTQ